MRRAIPLVVALAVASFLGFLGAVWWPLDLFTHFKLHYALLALPLAVFLSVRRDWGSALVAWLVVALNAGFIVPLSLGPDAPEDGLKLRVFVANLNRDNLRFADIARAAVDSDADVVGLVEVGDRAVEELRRPLAAWPYRAEHPRPDNFGLALYSRHPIVLEDRIPQPGTGFPTLRAVIETKGKERVQFALVHLPPPLTAEWSEARDLHLGQLAKMRADTSGRFVLMGDFNATPWSQGLRRAIHDAGFRRAGFGLLATWPSRLGPLGIPIDHVLLHGPITAAGAEVGPEIGSDHRPVVADLVLLPAVSE